MHIDIRVIMKEKYYYLITALKNYRKIVYGQFDQESSYIVKETQDAAKALEELAIAYDELKSKYDNLINLYNVKE